jgi:hypothetical protein
VEARGLLARKEPLRNAFAKSARKEEILERIREINERLNGRSVERTEPVESRDEKDRLIA